MNINAMPDDCFIEMFKQNFTLQEWLLMRAVCTRWNAVIKAMCRSKRSLKLFRNTSDAIEYGKRVYVLKLGDDPLFKLKPIGSACGNDDLVISPAHLEMAMYRFLFRLFPALDHLVVYFSRGNFFDVPYMLEGWSQLKSLALFGQMPANCHYHERVYEAIYSLDSLKRLGFFVSSDRPFELKRFVNSLENGDPQGLPMQLAQVEHFSTTTAFGFPLMANLGPSCKEISIQDDFQYEQESLCITALIKLVEKKPDLAAALTSLTLMATTNSLDRICENMPSLTHLSVEVDSYLTSTELVHSLRKLKRLTNLRLSNWPLVFRFDDSEEADLEQQQPPKILPLPSIKVIRVDGYWHDEAIEATLTLFPKLERMYLHETKDELRALSDQFKQVARSIYHPQVPELLPIPGKADVADILGRHAEQYLLMEAEAQEAFQKEMDFRLEYPVGFSWSSREPDSDDEEPQFFPEDYF